MKLRTLALAALAPLCLAFVHDFGNNYDNARFCAVTSIEIDAGQTLSIANNAIHWRKDLFDMVKTGASVQFFKPDAWRRKIANAKVPAAMTLGGQAIGAGDWSVAIRVPADDTSKFFLSWTMGDKTVDVPLAMTGGHDAEDHLLMALTPRGIEKESKAFSLKVWYGDLAGSIAGSFDAAAASTSGK